MALERQPPRRLHPRRAAADDRDPLPRRGGFDRPLPLEPGLRIDGAAHMATEIDLADAGVAIDARADVFLPPFLQLAREMRVGQQLAAHRQEVEMALGDVAVGVLQGDPAGGDHRDIDRPADSDRVGDELLRDMGGMGDRMADAVGHVGIGADIDRVESGRLGQLCGHAGVADGDPLVDQELLGVDSCPDRVVGAHGSANALDDVAQEPGAVLDRAAIFVGPLVGIGRQEGRDDIAVPAMDLDRVDSSALGPLSRRRKHLHQPLDPLRSEHLVLDRAHLGVGGGEDAELIFQKGIHHVAGLTGWRN